MTYPKIFGRVWSPINCLQIGFSDEVHGVIDCRILGYSTIEASPFANFADQLHREPTVAIRVRFQKPLRDSASTDLRDNTEQAYVAQWKPYKSAYLPDTVSLAIHER